MEMDRDGQKESQEQDHKVTSWWGRMWLIVVLAYSVAVVFFVFYNNPEYLRDWRAGAIILLSSVIVGIYTIGIRLKWYQEPRHLTYRMGMWALLYVTAVALSALNGAFAYDFYIVLGISFILFSGPLLYLSTCILYLSLCWMAHILTWPPTLDEISSMVGIGMSFFSTTMLGVALQAVVRQRNQHNQFLQELQQVHGELEQAHQQLAEAAAQQQELAVLRERTRLAREMHDTLGHALVLISVKLEAAQRLRERDPLRSERELETSKEIARESMKELRASIANLRSPALEREPACRAISRYARDMAQRAGLHVSYDLHPDIEGLPEQIEETLWKVGQEALVNIEKHAQASEVQLHISRRPGHIYMKIQDNGVGLPVAFLQQQPDGGYQCSSPEGHYGLSGMRERIEQLQGHLTLHPLPERGTQLEVELPLVEEPLPLHRREEQRAAS